LEQGLGRKLTEREHLGILDVANRQGLSDAKEAYARWREDEGAPHPKAEDEDTRLERVSERYDDLRRQHQAEGTAPESFTADHAGGETDQAAE
jgi:hypothetical protein